MGKIKLTESQIAMLVQREKDLSKKKVLKITESQYNSIFKNYDKGEKKMDKSIKNLNLESDEPKKDLDPLEFAQELIIFIKDLITNPRQVPYSKYWMDLDISRGELFKMIRDEGLITKMSEGDDSTSYSTKKNGFRKGIKRMFNELNNVKGNISEDDYDNDPNDPRNEPTLPDREVSKHENYQGIYYNERNEQLMIFNRDGNLFAINGDAIPNEYINQYSDFDGIIDSSAINEYVNEAYHSGDLDLGDEVPGASAVDKLLDGRLVFIDDEVKAHLFEYYGDDIKMVEILNQIPDQNQTRIPETDSGSSGQYTGAGGAPIQKRFTQHSPSTEMGTLPKPQPEMLDEDLAINKYKVRINLDDNGGDTSPFFDEFYQVQEYMNMLEKKGIVTGVEVSKTNDKGIAKAFVYDFNGREWEKRNDAISETDTAGVGGQYDVNGFGTSDFMNAGNKMNKGKGGMPMVKRGGMNESFHEPDGTPIGVDPMHRPINKGGNIQRGQVYSNGSGKIRIDRIVQHDPENPEFSDSNTTLKVTRWGGGSKDSFNIPPSELGGWTLMEHKVLKKVLKLTETQITMLGEVEALKKKSR